jgi:hypothetical protein
MKYTPRIQMVCCGCLHVFRRIRWDADMLWDCPKCHAGDTHYTVKEARPIYESIYKEEMK